jgi:hypothetical protein
MRASTEIFTETSATAFAIKILLDIEGVFLKKNMPGLLLCGHDNYLITMKNSPSIRTQIIPENSIKLLLDKRKFSAGNYAIKIMQGDNIFNTGQSISIAPPLPYEKNMEDCIAIKNLLQQKAFSPIPEYFCDKTT